MSRSGILTKMTNLPHEPMYGWAVDENGRPIPISAAERGKVYYCPVCEGEMVAKKGDMLQHHFAHKSLLVCTADTVARKVAGLWVAHRLRQAVAAGNPVEVDWTLPHDDKPFKINILKDVASIQENHDKVPNPGDIILRNAAGKAMVVVFLGLDGPPEAEKIAGWVRQRAAIIKLNPVGVRDGRMDLATLMAGSEVINGWLLLDNAELPADLIMEPEQIRQLLLDEVDKPPYRFYGSLTDEQHVSHVLHVGDHKVWLPPDMWSSVFGGSVNKLASDVSIVIRDMETGDGAHIALFYVDAHESNAIAIRRYPAGEPMMIDLKTSAYTLKRTTSLEIAEELAGGPIVYPR